MCYTSSHFYKNESPVCILSLYCTVLKVCKYIRNQFSAAKRNYFYHFQLYPYWPSHNCSFMSDYWRSSIPRRMFSTIQTWDRDRVICSSRKFLISIPLTRFYLGFVLEGQIMFLSFAVTTFLQKVNYLKTKIVWCFIF